MKKLFVLIISLVSVSLSTVSFAYSSRYENMGKISELNPTQISFSKEDLAIGKTIFFDSGIKNKGKEGTGVFNIKWYVNDIECGYGSHDNVPGKTTVMNGNSQFTWTPTYAGEYTIKFVVDCDNHVYEKDEENNSTWIKFKILPDLEPTEITFSKKDMKVGEPIFFDSGIINSGNAPTGVFNIRWYINNMDCGYGSHADIDANTTVMDGNSQCAWTPTKTGKYTMKFVVDCDNHFYEKNEENNTRSVTFRITN